MMSAMIKSFFILVVGLASFFLLNSLGSALLKKTTPNTLYSSRYNSLRDDPVFRCYFDRYIDELIKEHF